MVYASLSTLSAVFHTHGDVFFWRIDYRLSPFDVLRAGFETAFQASSGRTDS
jgi:hypothetical protein